MTMPLPTIPTPIEGHYGVWVKREDLCCPLGPPFSKMRGVLAHLSKRPEHTIGVLDTSHSKAGWAVAFACQLLGKNCINYWPFCKGEQPEAVRPLQIKSQDLGATLVPLPATKSAILFHRAKKHLAAGYEDSYMIANALKLEESVEETAQEVDLTISQYDKIIVSVSSGTIAGGLLRGLGGGLLEKQRPPQVYIHLGYSRSEKAVRRYLQRLAPIFPQSQIQIVDEGYQYSEYAKGQAPFPCNEYYDLKAWVWLLKQEWGKSKVLFWNIGG